MCVENLVTLYQTWHFARGFMGLPKGHWKSRANSAMFEKGPRTRNMSGAWTPVNTRSFNAFGLYLAHQTLAALTQKSCLCVYSRPGSSFSSSPLRETQLSEKDICLKMIILFFGLC